MRKRKTFELDEKLLERARRALGAKAMRATVEEALRRAVRCYGRGGRVAVTTSAISAVRSNPSGMYACW